MRFVCAGAGSAGLGVCAAILQGMVSAGMDREEAISRFVLCDHLGAIGAADGAHDDPHYPDLVDDTERVLPSSSLRAVVVTVCVRESSCSCSQDDKYQS